jgi:hypothetical protein
VIENHLADAKTDGLAGVDVGAVVDAAPDAGLTDLVDEGGQGGRLGWE